MTDIGTEGAVAKSKGMYTDKSKYDVTSTLIYGVQWDAIMAWIDPNYKTSSCKEDSYVRDSTGKGNYEENEDDANNPAKCGSSDNYRIKNIYDLAGNVYEWTMEAYSTNARVIRGGSYLNNTGYVVPVSRRADNGPDTVYSNKRISRYSLFIILNKNSKIIQ